MPQVTAHERIRFLKAQGFIEDRQAGGQLTLWHAGRSIAITVPVHTGAILAEISSSEFFKDAGFSVDEYFRLR
jgi:predicted RNA binding protein YcfA (HicA-like mRNA interferase family)